MLPYLQLRCYRLDPDTSRGRHVWNNPFFPQTIVEPGEPHFSAKWLTAKDNEEEVPDTVCLPEKLSDEKTGFHGRTFMDKHSVEGSFEAVSE